MDTETKEPLPGIWQLTLLWASIGIQSFGGGASTTLLIQRTFVEKHRWLTMEEFGHLWSLCQLAPGINLVAITILIGNRLAGSKGVIVSLIGLLIPSATVTALLTAGFQHIEYLDSVQHIMKGVVPAVSGVLLLLGFNFARPPLELAYKEGIVNIVISLIAIVGCTLAITLFNAPVIIILPGMGIIGIVLFTRPLLQKKVTSTND